MNGRHEAAQMILECRRVQRRGDGIVITEDMARDIAVMWQSPGRGSVGITAFASSGKRLPSLRSEVEREICQRGYTPSDRLLLRSLLAWITGNPIEVIRYEHVFFRQGDDADELLKIIYPEWSHGSASTGFPDGADEALTYAMGWDNGEPTDQPDSYERPDASYGASMVSNETHVLAWHFGLGWVSLSRIEREVG